MEEQESVSPTTTGEIPRSHIRRISVGTLFGLYTYDLESPAPTSADQALMILYGDNGSGKTTLLKLVLYLFSYQRARGHKTFIGLTPFKHVEVELANGFRVGAYRTSGEIRGDYTHAIYNKTKRVAEHVFHVVGNRIPQGTPKDERNYVAFLEHLKDLHISFHYLGDDRQIATSDSETSHEATFEELVRARTLKLTYAHVVETPEPQVETSEQRLEAAIERAHKWIIRRTQQATDTGALHANTIYAQLVHQIASYGGGSKTASLEPLRERIESLAHRNAGYAKFGLTPQFDGTEFVRGMATASQETQPIISNLLEPYIAGLEARLDALQAVQAILHRFVSNLSEFYTGKQITFTLTRGFSIVSANGDALEPRMLSSGERQLLLLLCNALAARATATIFIIDEPEISLNVKWQRMLVRALLDCLEGSDSQLLLATHSIELLAQFRDQVLRLESTS